MIVKILKWLLAYFEKPEIQEAPPYRDFILKEMRRWEEIGASGDWKAHQVYAAAQKKFKDRFNKADLRLEIELLHKKYFRS